jgi:hypothetical protein
MDHGSHPKLKKISIRRLVVLFELREENFAWQEGYGVFSVSKSEYEEK